MNARETLVNIDEIRRYGDAVSAVRNGSMDPDRFMAFRLQHGIYGQRQDGVHMVRVKVPGGRLNSAQLRTLAAVTERFAGDRIASVTTRQDIQLHFVPLDETPALMDALAETGLTTREACGNTVRNITACTLAGVCPREHTDVGDFVDATVTRFLRHPLTQHLPRKFKMSFSGCEHDCAMGMMHDVGIVAVRQGDAFGFRVLAGGGLGHKPHEAIVVEEFITERDLLPCIEALITLHNRHSDRKRRAKARIKFLVDRFGSDGFRERYQEEFARTRAAYADQAHPVGRWVEQIPGGACGAGAPRRVIAQKQTDAHVLPISLPRGDITPAQLRGLADLMDRAQLTDARTTVDQNLVVIGIPTARLAEVRSALQSLGLSEPRTGDDVVSCPGTTTCRLGITSSKLVAAKLSGGAADLRIRVSGCHNSCGQHHVGDIGIHGEGKRIHGKLVPCYAMHFGGVGTAGGSIAIEGPVVPSGRIEAAINRVQERYLAERGAQESFTAWSRGKGEAYFEDLLRDLCQVSAHEIGQLARDHGDEAAFQVLQLGGGECAGAAQDRVASNFSEAMHERTYRNAFVLQRKFSEATECAEQILRVVGNSLLFLAGRQPAADLQGLAAELATALPAEPVAGQFASLLQALDAQREDASNDTFSAIANAVDAWTVDAGRLCQSLDQHLDLATSLPELGAPAGATGGGQLIDLSAYSCPLPYIKARHELRRAEPGQVLKFILANGESTQQVSASLASDGHEIIGADEQLSTTVLQVRRAGGAGQPTADSPSP